MHTCLSVTIISSETFVPVDRKLATLDYWISPVTGAHTEIYKLPLSFGTWVIFSTRTLPKTKKNTTQWSWKNRAKKNWTVKLKRVDIWRPQPFKVMQEFHIFYKVASLIFQCFPNFGNIFSNLTHHHLIYLSIERSIHLPDRTPELHPASKHSSLKALRDWIKLLKLKTTNPSFYLVFNSNKQTDR